MTGKSARLDAACRPGISSSAWPGVCPLAARPNPRRMRDLRLHAERPRCRSSRVEPAGSPTRGFGRCTAPHTPSTRHGRSAAGRPIAGRCRGVGGRVLLRSGTDALLALRRHSCCGRRVRPRPRLSAAAEGSKWQSCGSIAPHHFKYVTDVAEREGEAAAVVHILSVRSSPFARKLESLPTHRVGPREVAAANMIPGT